MLNFYNDPFVFFQQSVRPKESESSRPRKRTKDIDYKEEQEDSEDDDEEDVPLSARYQLVIPLLFVTILLILTFQLWP